MDPSPDAALLIAALPLMAAALFDVRHRIIPDWAVFGVALGVLPAVAAGAAAAHLLAGLGCLALGVLLTRLGAWGLGDAKLLGAAGLVAGPAGLLPLLAGTAVAGGVLAALLLAVRGTLLAGALAVPAGAPRWIRAEARRLKLAPTVPYALAIAAGLAIHLVGA